MDISALLSGSVADQIASAVSSKLKIPENKARDAIGIASNLLVAGLAKNSTNTKEAENISQALADDHDGSILKAVDSKVLDPAVEQDGFKILDHVLGKKDGIASNLIAKKLNMNSSQVNQILALIAPFIMGALGKNQAQSNYNTQSLVAFLQNLMKQGSSESTDQKDVITNVLNQEDNNSFASMIFNFFRKIISKIFG